MSNRRPIVLAGTTIAFATVALAASRWIDAEPTVRVIPDPAGQRATILLNAADTAMAHGKPEIARFALASAYDQPTASPEIAYRLARLADRLDEVGTAARAYGRYLSVASASPAADTARTRLLALVSGPLRARAVPTVRVADVDPVVVVPVAARLEAAGETERARTPDATFRRAKMRQQSPRAPSPR